MTSDEERTTVRRAVREVVSRLNEAWPARRWDELLDVLDPDVVVAPTDGGPRVIGRAAVIDSYRDFLDQAVLHDFEMGRAAIDVFGNTAVAVCPYTVDYEIESGRWRESGRDVLVLRCAGATWSVVWRTVLTREEEPR